MDTQKEFIFFDCECCDGYRICSLGYIIIDEYFNIIEKRDILINPKAKFRLGRDGFDPRIHLAYSEDEFKAAKTFIELYDEIKNIFNRPNVIFFGHAVLNDLKFITYACKSYKLPLIDIKAIDTQSIYYIYNKKQRHCSLENIISDLEIDISNIELHKSCDDAEMSMLVVKEICKRLDCTLHDLCDLCSESLTYFDEEKAKLKKQIKLLLKKYSGSGRDRLGPKIAFASGYENNNDFVIILEKLLDNNFRYTRKIDQADYFVSNGNKEDGNEQKYASIILKNPNSNIKKITHNELIEMIDEKFGLKIDEFCKNYQRGEYLVNSTKKNKVNNNLNVKKINKGNKKEIKICQ